MRGELRRLRIAFLNSDLWLGGGSIFTLHLASELSERGATCQVFTLRDVNYLGADFAQAGIPILSVSHTSMIFEDRISKTLTRLKEFAPNVIVASADGATSEVLRYVPDDVVRIGVIHLVTPEFIKLINIYRSVFDLACAVSKEVAEALRNALGDGNPPIHQMDLGVSIPGEFVPRTFPANCPLRILYLGRLEDPAKRVRLFPEIFARLRKSGIPFVWNIAGEGPERAFLEQRLRSDNPAQIVRFHGPVEPKNVPSLLRENDVFLLTSDTESFCLSLHEAMAAGLVPVASNIPGRVGELVSGSAGIAVPTDDTEAYADAIIHLHHDREVMKEMSIRARDRIGSEYSIQAMSNRWINLLEKLEIGSISWPDRWRIKPPLITRNSIYFSEWLRPIRRLLIRLQSGWIKISG